MSRHQHQPINWGRKVQGGLVGFCCGSVVGVVANVLHTRRLKPTPQTLSTALFMGTVLGIGGAIRSN